MRHPDERRPWHQVRFPDDPAKQYALQKIAKHLDEIEAASGQEAAEREWEASKGDLGL